MVRLIPKMAKNLTLPCRDLFARYGGIVRLNLGIDSLYLVGDHEYADRILRERSDHFKKSGKFWAGARPVFGQGLALSDGELWLRQRRLMQPVFTRSRFATLSGMMTTAIQEQLDGWSATASDRPIPLGAKIDHISMEITLRAIFNAGVSRAEREALGASAHVMWNNIHFLTWAGLLPKWVALSGARRCTDALQDVDRFVFKTISQRRQSGPPPADQPSDILSLLLAARDDETQEGMSDQQIRDEAITMVLAGYETTAATITWCIYELCRHPDVEQRLRSEIEQVLGKRVPTYEDLAHMPYVRMVISETLRFHSTAWMTLRIASSEEELGGYRIPAGSVLVVLIDAIHHNPAVWPEPGAFKPERFSQEASARRPRAAFIPFGIGPHQCIGNNFAILEASLVLIMLVQRYRVRLVSSAPVESIPRAIQKPKREILVHLDTAS